MNRREFISLLGGAAAEWPLVAGAQEPGRIYRVGGLHASARDAPHHLALYNELRRLGFIEGASDY
jgi:putative ABC transport system substrate-binding protein